MADLLTTYANFCGVKVTKEPVITTSFYPTPESYITIHPESGMPSKDYDYYEDVISIIKPLLDKNNISIIQIGTDKNKHINGCISFAGQTSISQSAYIIKNSKLHIGNDSVWAHVAGKFKVPLVELFGPTLSKVCGPSFHGDYIPIESHRMGLRPSFNSVENPKTINYIKPEEVANAVFKLLKIDNSKNCEINSLFFGESYPSEMIEIVPDHLINPDIIKNKILFVRMDYLFDQNNLSKILQSIPVVVLTNRRIDFNLINFYKDNIKQLIYFVNEKYDIDFIRFLHRSSIDYRLIAFKNKSNISKIRYELLDYNPVIEFPAFDKSKIEKIQNISHNTFVKTTKVLLSKGKPYISKYHWQNSIPMKNENQIGQALNEEDFWENGNYFYLYNKS